MKTFTQPEEVTAANSLRDENHSDTYHVHMGRLYSTCALISIYNSKAHMIVICLISLSALYSSTILKKI